MGFVVDNHSPDRQAWADWLTSIGMDPSNIRSVEVHSPTSLGVVTYVLGADGRPAINDSKTEVRTATQTVELVEPIPADLRPTPF